MVGVLILLVVALWFWATTPRSDEEIRGVAAQLKLPSSWQIERESSEPPSPVCGSYTTPCPSIWQWWSSDKPLTFDQIESAITDAGYSIRSVEKPARMLEGGYCQDSCSFTADIQVDRDYEIHLSYYHLGLGNSGDTAKSEIQFYVIGR